MTPSLSVWDQLLHTSPTTRLTRDEYLNDIAHLRQRPSSRGVAWRVDTLSVRLPRDQAWEAWRAGDRQRALDLVAEDHAAMRRQHQEWARSGIFLHRLVNTPDWGDYTEFAWVAQLGFGSSGGGRVRVIHKHPLPELTVYGNTLYRLLADADHIAAGADRIEEPALVMRVRRALVRVWRHAEQIQ